MTFFQVIFTISSISADMGSAHNDGSSFANNLLNGVQQSSTNTNLKDIPNFSTTSPKESTYSVENLGHSACEVSQNEGALMIKESSNNRQTFKLDPDTDPMFINANNATLNPEKTMDEVIMQEPNSNGDDEGTFLCEEAGEEYEVKCTKHRSLKIRIIPRKTKIETYCPGHDKKILGIWHRNKRCKKHCKSREVVTQHRKVEVIEDTWVDGCIGFENLAEEGFCRYDTFSKGTQETKTIHGDVVNPDKGQPKTDSEPITRDSWWESYTYKCFKKTPSNGSDNCHKLRALGCIQTGSKCLESINGQCIHYQHIYKCLKGKNLLKYKFLNKDSPFCLSGNCADTSYLVNTELASALSQLSVLKQAQDDIRANVGIFKGQAKQCRRNCANFKDCCKNGKGWGVSMHLSECRAEEKELADLRDKKRCVYIGTYCAQKAFGVCIKKKSSFCCFGTKLARLINSQARAQLGINWGDPKCPDCRGLSPSELSRIDMSKMDLSELYEDINKNFKPPSGEHMAKGIELERIRENMKHLSSKSSSPSIASHQINQHPINKGGLNHE